MMPILSLATLMAAGLLGGVGLVFGLIVWLTVDGRVGDGYSFASAMVGGFRSWADDLEIPAGSPASGDGGPAAPGERQAEDVSVADEPDTVDLSPDEAPPRDRVPVHVGLRGPHRPD